MTNHMNAAIEAAAKTLSEESQELDQDNNWDELPEDWRDSWRDTARETIDAMLPHIRAMIAEEIRGDVKDFEPSCKEDIVWYDAHMNAARIAKGSQ